jgi:hypothetical protein
MFNICDLKTNKYLQKEILNSVDACVTAVVFCVSFAQNLKFSSVFDLKKYELCCGMIFHSNAGMILLNFVPLVIARCFSKVRAMEILKAGETPYTSH